MTITANILNINKLTKINLITKKHTMFTPFTKHAYSHRTCLTYFNLTKLQILADHAIVLP